MAYQKDRLRRTMLFIPGNNPSMMPDAHLYGADALMFDLEDSVKASEKDAARDLVSEALKTFDYGDVELVVRVNPLNTPHGKADVMAMIAAGVHVIRMPKTETALDITEADAWIGHCERTLGLRDNSIGLMAAIESGLGILNVQAIAMASERLIGIAIGAEDFVTDLKTTRSPEGTELFTARSMIVFAARAAGIAALDTVFSDVNDEEGFKAEVALIKQMGFDGKSVINPRQIAPVNEIYTPSQGEIDKARAVISAIEEAEAKGLGVVSLNGKMIDRPVVLRAQRVMQLAMAAGGKF